MPNPAAGLALSEDQKSALDALVRNGNTPQKIALRCRLVLLAHEGIANYRYSEAEPPSQGVDTRTGTEDSRRHFEDPPRRRQHALERSNAGETLEDLPHHRSPSLAAP